MTTQRHAHHRTHLTTQLTRRQRDVLARVADGKTNPEIAGELGITLDGVKWHVSEILARLGVSTREEAAAAWRTEQSTLARLRRALGLTPLAAKPMAMIAGGTGVFISALVVLIVAMVVRGGGYLAGEDSTPTLTPTVVTAGNLSTPTNAPESSPTALPGGGLDECGAGDIWIATHRDPLPGGQDILAGYSLLSLTPCRLVGDWTVTVLSDGQPVEMPGNPATVRLDLDVFPTGLAAAGIRLTWANSCAFHAEDYAVRLVTPAYSTDSSPHHSYPRETGTGCVDEMSLAVQEAHWDRHSYLSNLVPDGTLASNALPTMDIPGESECGFEVWVCEAKGYVDHWIANGDWGRPAAFGQSFPVFCGEKPDFIGIEVVPEFRVVPMEHPNCERREVGDSAFGMVVLDFDANGELVETVSSWSDTEIRQYGRPEKLVSVGCATDVPRCEHFVLAMEFSDSEQLVYVAYLTAPTAVDTAGNSGWGRTDAPAARTGGIAMTMYGETEFVPLP